MLKKMLKKIIPEKYHEKIYKILMNPLAGYARASYSQEGEDIVLSRFFDNAKKGFYVDIGAHHPKRFSNTYYFYKLGWRGINLDAMPGSMKLFKKIRPRDINLEVAISDKKQVLTYYAFNESALNGFSRELSLERDKKESCKVVFKREIKTETLSDTLDKYLPDGQSIDFMSVDVEGLDLEVLKSNNWVKYIPSYILVEILDNNWRDVMSNEICDFLHDKGYEIVAKTRDTALFMLKGIKSKKHLQL